MIKKILIANRGEIALRIIRTCKEMGIKTVTIYPKGVEKDQFLETRFSDEAYCLGEEGILGYLDQRKLIQIAKLSGADAIHPGYGFLSENGDFSDLCQRNEIKFIGPKGETLRRLGNKIEAKKVAKDINSPILPGSIQPLRDENECEDNARRIRPPFILKAANGGGGVGIQVIYEKNKRQVKEIFQKLKREVMRAFGSGDIFIEKFLPNPRHIEIQILGDGKGKVLHLGERECSIQRRHQKLIEEAPSPSINNKIRRDMQKIAVKMGEFLKYESLGTVEFLVDNDGKFYFLEVNPRIQVEHPVTEIITGIDLVEQQIRIASGEELKLKQSDINFSNWAMEFRINAEDPFNDFRPQAGTISKYIPPIGRGIEVHSFCQDNQKIFPFFDNLLAKLVVFGKDRDQVIKRAERAFSEFVIEGTPNLINFYKVLIKNQKFCQGIMSTSFIEDEKIIEEFKKVYPEGEKIVTKNEEIVKEEEIAMFVANLYDKFKKREDIKNEVNNWKMSAMQEFEAN